MYWTYFSRGIFYQSKSDERKNIFEPQTSKKGKYFFIKETISLNSSFM